MINTQRHDEAIGPNDPDRLAALFLSDDELTEEEREAIFCCIDRAGALWNEALERYYDSLPATRRLVARDRQPELVAEGWREIALRLGLSCYETQGKVRILVGQRWKGVALRAAAVLMPVALVVGGYFGLELLADRESGRRAAALATAEQQIEPSADSVRRITLADGTRVTLNRGASFAYNNSREGQLQGEAYFEVAKDPGRPFIIHSEHVTVRVLGTEFNFSTRDDRGLSRLALYDGAVELEYAAGRQRLERAGKEFTLDHITQEAVVGDFDPTARPEWMTASEDVFVFVTFGAIFDRIEQTYGVTISGRETIDQNRELNFVFDEALSIGNVMSMLEFSHGGFSHTIEGNNIIINADR